MPAKTRSTGRRVTGSMSEIVCVTESDFDLRRTPWWALPSSCRSLPQPTLLRPTLSEWNRSPQPSLLRRNGRRGDRYRPVEPAQVNLHRARRAVVAERAGEDGLADQAIRPADPDRRLHIPRRVELRQHAVDLARGVRRSHLVRVDATDLLDGDVLRVASGRNHCRQPGLGVEELREVGDVGSVYARQLVVAGKRQMKVDMPAGDDHLEGDLHVLLV